MTRILLSIAIMALRRFEASSLHASRSALLTLKSPLRSKPASGDRDGLRRLGYALASCFFA
jgi:hypothetical protein